MTPLSRFQVMLETANRRAEWPIGFEFNPAKSRHIGYLIHSDMGDVTDVNDILFIKH